MASKNSASKKKATAKKPTEKKKNTAAADASKKTTSSKGNSVKKTANTGSKASAAKSKKETPKKEAAEKKQPLSQEKVGTAVEVGTAVDVIQGTELVSNESERIPTPETKIGAPVSNEATENAPEAMALSTEIATKPSPIPALVTAPVLEDPKEMPTPQAVPMIEAAPAAESPSPAKAPEPILPPIEEVTPEEPPRAPEVSRAPTLSLPDLTEEELALITAGKSARSTSVRKKEKDLESKKGHKQKKQEHDLVPVMPSVDFPELVTGRLVFSRAILLLVILAVFFVATLIFFFRPAVYTQRLQSVQYLYSEEDDETEIFVNGTSAATFDGKLQMSRPDGRGYTNLILSDGGELFLLKGEKLRHIASDVTDGTLSVNGKIFVYLTGEKKLYRQETGKKSTPSLISQNVTEGSFCLSPNGKELLYVENSDGTPKMEAFSEDGKMPYIADTANYSPIAIADGCKYLYFHDHDGRLFIYSRKTKKMTDCGTFTADTLLFNRTLDELFFKDGTACRFYIDSVEMHLTLGESETLSFLPNVQVATLPLSGGTHYLHKSLLENYYVFRADSALQVSFLSREKDSIHIDKLQFADSEDVISVTDKYVFFISTDTTANNKRSNLYCVKNGKTEVTRLMADVVEYLPNVDGSRILFRDSHGPLRAMRVGAAPIQLADEIEPNSLSVSAGDIFYYRTPNGDLYRSENGDAPELLAENVSEVVTDAHVVIYVVEGSETEEIYTNYRNRRKSELVFTRPLTEPAPEPSSETAPA